MKILWIAKADKPDSDHQCDHLFHGLRTLLGPDIVDVTKAWRAYASSFDSNGEGCPEAGGIKSFTFGGLLPDIEVDRTDIQSKIASHYFDFVFYGSVSRDRSFQAEVLEAYPASKIVFIDGEDDQFYQPEKGKGFYFKREMPAPDPDVYPIHFAIPKEKILEEWYPKSHLMAPVNPYDKSTYISSEHDYYKQYAESYFGRTMKRGGWDCLRHYEIMAAGALPYFDELEHCPELTMFQLPKKELLAARNLYDTEGERIQLLEWQTLMDRVRIVLREKLTTEALAKYVLDTVTK